MRLCKKCGEKIPSRVTVDGKTYSLSSRSYCLICSPLNQRGGYELRKEQSRHGNLKNPTKSCPICDRSFPWTKNDVCTGCRSAIQRYKKRNRAYAYLGGKCVVCGETDQIVLTFHHRNRDDKSFELSYSWLTKSWEDIQIELDKCVLMCSNCHLRTHANETQVAMERIRRYYHLI